jgi:hypothetical protein
MSENNETGAADTSIVDVPADSVDSFNLEDLINTHFEDPVMSEPGLEHKIGLPYDQIIKHIPENGRKVIQNLRASYTKKTQELAQERAQIESLKEELDRQKRMMTDSDWAKGIRAAAEDNSELDVWDEDGRKASIKREAAKMMADMIKPLQQEIAQEKRSVEIEKFKTSHPDLAEHRVEIAKLLMERSELKLEDAYYLVKAKATTKREEEERATKVAHRTQTKEALMKTSTGKNIESGKLTQPKFKDAWSAYQWHKANGMK